MLFNGIKSWYSNVKEVTPGWLFERILLQVWGGEGFYLVFWQDKTHGASDMNGDKQQCPEMSHFCKP